jgi:hypothetical protein
VRRRSRLRRIASGLRGVVRDARQVASRVHLRVPRYRVVIKYGNDLGPMRRRRRGKQAATVATSTKMSCRSNELRETTLYEHHAGGGAHLCRMEASNYSVTRRVLIVTCKNRSSCW